MPSPWLAGSSPSLLLVLYALPIRCIGPQATLYAELMQTKPGLIFYPVYGIIIAIYN